jgi:hypothetical protein
VALESRGGHLQPYRPGFWAVDYDPNAALWNRQKYIDPRTGKVWESLEEALRFIGVDHVMPDITARDVYLPSGPPGEAAFRISQEVPTILPRPAGSAPVVTAVPEVSSGVPVQSDEISNWRVNQEHELRKALEREETEPELQSIDTSMLSRLIPSAQASDLAPLPRPLTSEELWEDRIDRGVALQELLALEEAPSGPTQLEQPEVGPSLLEPPPIRSRTIDLPGGKIVNGKLVLDESREAWREFMRREPREIEPSLWDGPERPELLNLWDSIEEAGSKIKEVATNLWDYMPSPISASEASSTIPTEDQFFFDNWHDNYYSGDKKEGAFLYNAGIKLGKLRRGTLPLTPIAEKAIDIAVDIFGTDYGKDGKARKKRYGKDRLREDLRRIGALESSYSTVVAGNPKNTDSGYWQVQPETAKNSLEHARAHFGENFDDEFRSDGWTYDKLLQMTEDELQALMRVEKERNQALAASFAAVKILQTFDY